MNTGFLKHSQKERGRLCQIMSDVTKDLIRKYLSSPKYEDAVGFSRSPYAGPGSSHMIFYSGKTIQPQMTTMWP